MLSLLIKKFKLKYIKYLTKFNAMFLFLAAENGRKCNKYARKLELLKPQLKKGSKEIQQTIDVVDTNPDKVVKRFCLVKVNKLRLNLINLECFIHIFRVKLFSKVSK